MDKQEMAIRILNLIGFNDMIDREIKKQTDGKPSFCDDEEYKKNKALLCKACLHILSDNDKGE